MTFMEKLSCAMQKNNSLVCVGLDPAIGKLPECIRNKPDAIYEFNCRIVDATKDLVCAYKPQAAYYAGQDCDEALKASIAYIKEVAPDVRAALFWLQNRRPKRWKNVCAKKKKSGKNTVNIQLSPVESEL